MEVKVKINLEEVAPQVTEEVNEIRRLADCLMSFITLQDHFI